MSVLQVGRIEPSLANALAAKYQVLQLPDDSSRAALLAKHGGSVIAVVDFGPPGVDADLMDALLDVFTHEPYVPTELRDLDNVVLTPHLAGATFRALAATRKLVLRNLDQYLTCGTLTTPVVPPNGNLRQAIHG